MKGLARPYRARRSWDAYPDDVTASKPPNVNVALGRQQLRVASSSAVSQFASSPLDVDQAKVVILARTKRLSAWLVTTNIASCV